MSDSWKASVLTIAGKPVVAMDVNIRRSLLIDPAVFDVIKSMLGESDMKSARDFISSVQDAPADTRRFFAVPLTQADQVKINIGPFANIVQLFSDRNYVRITGDATRGFEGIANLAGVEKFVDMSRANLPNLNKQLELERTKAQEAADRGEITKDQAAVIDAYCKAFGDRSVGCEALYAAHEKMLKEKEAAEREKQQRELEAREHDTRGNASEHRGSIGDKNTGYATNRF